MKVFLQRGLGQDQAYQRAMKLMDNTVQKHSLLFSYIDGYLFIGIFFALAIPLLLFVAKRKKGPVVIPTVDH